MRIKKSCSKCKANQGSKCSLGFKADYMDIPILNGLRVIVRPKEICPKPTTIKKLIRAEEQILRPLSP